VRRIVSIFVLSFIIFGCAVPESGIESDITTFFLVRHAEKADDGTRDPDLATVGYERAAELAYVLRNTELDAVYDTPYKRTRLTAKPAADSHKLKVETIQSLKIDDLKNFLDDVIAKHRGGNILIVSHSNIVPVLIKLILHEEFDVREIENINDSVFDDLFVVSFNKRETARVLNLKYGRRCEPVEKLK